MKLIVENDYEGLSKRASQILIKEIQKDPEIVLGLPTGSTPLGLYRKLIESYQRGEIDFTHVKTFNLDEYVGLEKYDPRSYNHYMNTMLFNHINMKPENIHIPNGKATNLESYCEEYNEDIERAGGIDVQVLGIGTEGHIGFNEPDDELNVGTSVIKLAPSTINDNAKYFKSTGEVPERAITMGLGSILKAKKIILLANGESKIEVIDRLLNRNVVTTQLPASFLLLHPDVTIIIDEEVYEGCR